MQHWVFFLEEPSAKVFLEGYLSAFLPSDVQLHFQVFEGKQDLEKRLELRLRHWRLPNSKFLVMRDQDSGDCLQIKSRLCQICANAGRIDAVVRIACRELESFFVGDWQAVALAFDRPSIASQANKSKYRTPDCLGNPSQELKRVIGFYSKGDGARRIAKHMHPERNTSKSFQALHKTLWRWARARNDIHLR